MNKPDEEPKTSIIIPVKNVENTIEELLESIFNADYPKEKIEVIIVDGRSTDKTVQKALKYPVKIFYEDGLGPNNARKIGVEKATGDILIFTDGDCRVPKNWIRKIVEEIKDSEVGCVGGSVFTDPALEKNLLAKYADLSVMRIMPLVKEREKVDRIRVFHHLAFCNMAIKREVIEKIGGLDENMKTFEDVDTVVSICEHGYKVLRTPKIYVWHKHRHRVKEILKQTYNYGKGGPKFRRKHPKSIIAKFYRRGLAAFTLYMAILAMGILVGLVERTATPIIILISPMAVGLVLGFIYYLFKLKSLMAAVLYPILDMLRIFAFCIGDLSEQLRKKI
ncbi:MAG: glycosyltransferase [archaeon GB-1867-097]|nr:glycosyltransferase [Candidatus Culexmicrobium thermophilum]MCS7384761.1 glycosyltransferase [Candidatus Culexmicrobium thermophilum]HDO20622.1 glycosyltransferase [Candidatus Bathyarchaeota archaeon]